MALLKSTNLWAGPFSGWKTTPELNLDPGSCLRNVPSWWKGLWSRDKVLVVGKCLNILGIGPWRAFHQPSWCPATSHRGRWWWRRLLCSWPPHGPAASRGSGRCCRAPLEPSAAPPCPAFPAGTGPSARVQTGSGTSAVVAGSPNLRWCRRWWGTRWHLCPPPSRHPWWQWSRTWRAPGFGLYWRSSRRTLHTQKSGTRPSLVRAVFGNCKQTCTWRCKDTEIRRILRPRIMQNLLYH